MSADQTAEKSHFYSIHGIKYPTGAAERPDVGQHFFREQIC